MSRLLCYGHIFDDTIVLKNPIRIIKKPGGVANFWRAARYFDAPATLTVTTSCQAVIIQDEEDKQEMVVWGRDIQYYPTNKGNDWRHFMYINRLRTLTPSILSKFGGIKSADICLDVYDKATTEHVLQLLPELDILFCNSKELSSLCPDYFEKSIKHIGNLVKKFVVVHEPNRIHICDGDVTAHFEVTKKQIKNIVGAGDILAAAIISELIGKDQHIFNIMRSAINKTGEYLVHEN